MNRKILGLLVGAGFVLQLFCWPLPQVGAQTWNATNSVGQTNLTTGGFNAQDADEYYAPFSTTVTAGGKYIVADTSNHRVLIYNSVPSSSGTAASVVVGQVHFNENSSGNGPSKLNQPTGVYSDGTKLFVADKGNNRVLIFNSIPTSNGASADVVVGQPHFFDTVYGTTQSKLNTPTAVFSDGTKLYVADSWNHRVMIWNTVPSVNGTAASVVLGQTDFVSASSGTSSTKFNYPSGVSVTGTNLFVTDQLNHRVLKYGGIPTTNSTPASIAIGQTNLTTGTSGLTSAKLNTPSAAFSDGTKLMVADSANHRVLIWNTIPTSHGAAASVVTGQNNFTTGTSGTSSTQYSGPTDVTACGGKMFVTDRDNHRSLIYNSIPTANCAAANLVEGHSSFTAGTANDVDGIGIWTPTAFGGACIAANKLFISDPNNHRVLIWNTIPTNNNIAANVAIGQANLTDNSSGTSSTKLKTPSGVFSDGTKVFVADQGNNRILIWNAIPTNSGVAASVVVGQGSFTNGAGGTSSTTLCVPKDVFVKSGKMYVADSANHRVLIYNSVPTTNGVAANVVVGQTDFTSASTGTSSTKYNYPSGIVTDGTKLLVTDRNNNRVLVYNTIPTTNGAAASVVVGQADFTNSYSSTAGTTASLLYGPERISLAPNTNRIYITDSVNSRVLIYDSIPTTNGVAANNVVGQTNYTGQSIGTSASRFIFPTAAFAITNRFYVLDSGNNRLLGGPIPNSPPILATIGNKAVNENQTLSFTISATDPDNGPSALTYSATNLPPGSSFVPATRSFSWVPSTAQIGEYANVRFQASDGGTNAAENITITVVGQERYGFETGIEGWAPGTASDGRACSSLEQATNAFVGSYGLKMNMNLIGGNPTNSYGEATVDMRWTPPSQTVIPVNLSNQVVSAYVYCPTGTLGNPSAPNGVQLFVKDEEFDGQYGAWSNVVENAWTKLSMTVTNAGSFNAAKIIAAGVKLGSGSTNSYNGPIYFDSVAFPIASVAPTDHLYTFGAGSQDHYPRWVADTNFNATAWTNAYLNADSLRMDAMFTTSGSAQKGFVGINFQPDLYLVNKDHHIIHVELKFNPVPAPFQFVGQIWVYDHGGERWYVSDDKSIGAGVGWNVMEFNLDDHTAYNPNLSAGQTMPLDQILTVGVQLYANSNYTGQVYIDNVTIGGREISSNYVSLNSGIIGRSGTNFVLNGTNWYFAGANAEYLIKRPTPVVQQVLTSATNMNLRIVRTWAFDEGKPYSLQPERGVWNEAAFEHMDRIIAEAGKRGLRLLLAMVDNWGHNGGMYKYMDWVYAEHPESVPPEAPPNTIAYHDEFFVNPYAKQWYKDYVTKLVNRTNTVTGVVYKNDPTIMGWEIVNEPRNETDPTGAEVHAWLKEMSDFVRGLDSNHLLAAGVEGGYLTTFSSADTRAYQSFPNNYWQYGLNGGGAGADYVSDGSSTDRTVYWQDGTWDNPGTVHSETRVGIPNLDFLTCRLYADQKEYNLWRTNVSGFDQRKEWMNEHRYDAHTILNKPMIVEEFGLHADIGWTYNGSFAEFRFHRDPVYSQSDRASIFQTYYNHIEATGINGSFFWNLGYDGLFEDTLNTCEATTNWTADGGSDATTVSLNTNTSYIVEGSGSLKCDYNSSGGYSKAWFSLNNMSEKWIRRMISNMPDGENRVKFAWRVYNPGSTIQCAVAVSTTGSYTWHESTQKTLSNGWNTVIVDLSSQTWKSAATGWANNGDIANLEDVRRVSFGLFGYSGTGSVYVDDVTIWFDDGFVIYPGDPAESVIKTHGTNMKNK